MARAGGMNGEIHSVDLHDSRPPNRETNDAFQRTQVPDSIRDSAARGRAAREDHPGQARSSKGRREAVETMNTLEAELGHLKAGHTYGIRESIFVDGAGGINVTIKAALVAATGDLVAGGRPAIDDATLFRPAFES